MCEFYKLLPLLPLLLLFLPLDPEFKPLLLSDWAIILFKLGSLDLEFEECLLDLMAMKASFSSLAMRKDCSWLAWNLS